MTGPGLASARGARAGMFAAVCVGLALVAHRAAAGPTAAPAPWVVLAALVAVTLLAWPLAGAAKSGRVAAGAMAGFQVALHAGFGLLAPRAAGSSAWSGLLCTGGHHPSTAALAHRLPAQFHAPSAGAAAGLLPAVTSASLLMLGGHVAAAVLAGAWLRRVDRAVRLASSLATELLTTVRRLLGPLRAGGPAGPRSTPRPAPRLAATRPASALTSRLAASTAARRGPPAVPAF